MTTEVPRDARGRRIQKSKPHTTLSLALVFALWLGGLAYSVSLIVFPPGPGDDWEPILMSPEAQVIGSVLAFICLWKAARALHRLGAHFASRTRPE